jgi:hypothetical protein
LRSSKDSCQANTALTTKKAAARSENPHNGSFGIDGTVEAEPPCPKRVRQRAKIVKKPVVEHKPASQSPLSAALNIKFFVAQ